MSQMNIKKPKSIALTEDTWSRLEQEALKLKRSRNNLIELILLDYLEKQKEDERKTNQRD